MNFPFPSQRETNFFNIFTIFIYYRTMWSYDIAPEENTDSEAEEKENG